MSVRARRAGCAIAASACLLAPGTAVAQLPPPPDQPRDDLPTLRERFPGGGGQPTPTPEPTPTATPEPSATPAPSARPDELARTGSDPSLLALGGLSLLGFGLALRLRLALDDARRHQRG